MIFIFFSQYLAHQVTGGFSALELFLHPSQPREPSPTSHTLTRCALHIRHTQKFHFASGSIIKNAI